MGNIDHNKKGFKKKSNQANHHGYSQRRNQQNQRSFQPETNAWRFEQDTNNRNLELLHSTISNCTRQLPFTKEIVETKDELNQDFSEVLRELSFEDQLSNGFLVPVPTLESEINQSFSTSKQTQEINTQQEEIKQEKSLDEWLDNLLG